MTDAEKLAAIIALVQRYNHAGCNTDTHALANKILALATGNQNEHK